MRSGFFSSDLISRLSHWRSSRFLKLIWGQLLLVIFHGSFWTSELKCSLFYSVREILDGASVERTGSLPGLQEGRSSTGKGFGEDGLRKSSEVDLVCSDLHRCPAAPLVQQRAQLEELRKFGKDFRVRSHLTDLESANTWTGSNVEVCWLLKHLPLFLHVSAAVQPAVCWPPSSRQPCLLLLLPWST